MLLALQIISGAAFCRNATDAPCADPACHSQVGVRYGEALHPGPAGPLSFSIYATNPSGLRGKEAVLLEHGSGVYLIAETQLSAVTQKSCRGQISTLGRASGKSWRTHFGAAAHLRANSDWAGTWTGVATISEYPSRGVKVQWPPQTFETGRIAITQHHVGNLPLLTAVVYGVPRSQAHTRALEDTERLLQPLTREVVLGRKGPRIIAGDFNHPAEACREIAIWQGEGWQELQDIALARWGTPVEMTCKGASRHDFVWLSPKAIALCHGASVHHSFADHVVLEAKFCVHSDSGTIFTWPRPSNIPWHEVDVAGWHAAAMPYEGSLESLEASQWFCGFTGHWEKSVSDHVDGPAEGLPPQCFGRAQRTEPAMREVAPSVLRASRPGEVEIASDLLSREVKRWFQQLRRLQSLRDSLRSGKTTSAASLYRSQLWSAVLRAKGFTPNFQNWWGRRVVQLHNAPAVLSDLPDCAQAQAIFDDFHQNYRRLEAWHARRRNEVLSAKHAESSKHLFAALKPARPPPLDTLTIRKDFEVLATDVDGCQVMLDAAPPCHGTSCFSVDGHLVDLCPIQGPLCKVAAEDLALMPEGAVVEQEQFVSEPAQVFHEFVKLWQPRWNQHTGLESAHWTRILNFTRFLRPVASFDFPPISATQWLLAVKRLKKQAARGPDAYARLDLLHMAPCHVTQLLQLLRRIELGQSHWPLQLLQGFVCAIDKLNNKCGADAYRPICLLSVIYRVWGSIRTKQVLRAIRHYVPDEMFGFVPHRETADMWILLQARIEVACSEGKALVGCMADVVKAFNGLPRAPLLRAAARLGFPPCVLTPWIGFISHVQRRFVMGEAVSAEVSSTSGFIEGDPLSVTAMSVASILFHYYMHHFEPCVQHASYVDNLAVTAESVFLAARGYTVMESFWELLGLQLDGPKTYFWAVHAGDRRLLKLLGLSVVEHRRELGGYLTFGPRHRVADMTERLELLQPLWHALRRSRAPMRHKWSAVTTKLWPIAFHGAASCWLSDGAIGKLRAKLAWALRWSCAGAGPDLRALTEGPMDLDPGFFQTWVAIRDFRRLALKGDGLRSLWTDFMRNFQGREFAGPFSTLLHHARKLEWGFAAPPLFIDHRGLVHDFLQVPVRTLRCLVEEAWAHGTMRKQSNRAAIADVGDLDVHLARELGSNYTGQQRAWLGMVRAGAAITNAQQAKFDVQKTSRCLHCQQDDTKAHRLFDSPLYERDGLCRIDEEHTALTEMLLPCWHPDLKAHLDELMQTPDEGRNWVRPAVECQHADIFTDGSCKFGDEALLALGAWAVVCAQFELVLASGLMTGLCQSIDRCELYAVVVALRWAAEVGIGVTIWTDSQYVFDGMMQLLHGEGVDRATHADLWEEAADLVDAIPRLYMQLVPSHVPPHLCDDPVAEFATRWNGVADRQAGQMCMMRTSSFLARHRRIVEHRRQQRGRLKALADQYVHIASVSNLARPQAPDPAEAFAEDVVQPLVLHSQGSFADLFSVDWSTSLPQRGGLDPGVGQEIVRSFIASDESVLLKCGVSWIELVFVLLGWGCLDTGSDRTLAFWVSSVRRLMRPLLTRFGAREWLVRGSVYGVTFPVECLIIGVPFDDVRGAQNIFQDWRAGRLIKKVADLARPLRV